MSRTNWYIDNSINLITRWRATSVREDQGRLAAYYRAQAAVQYHLGSFALAHYSLFFSFLLFVNFRQRYAWFVFSCFLWQNKKILKTLPQFFIFFIIFPYWEMVFVTQKKWIFNPVFYALSNFHILENFILNSESAKNSEKENW